MEFQKFIHTDVSKKGEMKGTVVQVDGSCLIISSGKHPFMTITMPRDNNGVVFGIHVRFTSLKEMKEVLKI